MELGLVCDLTDELASIGCVGEGHALEERRQAIAQPAVDPDPDASRCVHAADVRAGLRERASPNVVFTQARSS
jgi:hypothetical protein